MELLRIPGMCVVSSGKRVDLSIPLVACTAPPCNVAYRPFLRRVFDSGLVCLQLKRCDVKFLDIGFRFFGLVCIGPGESLGGWRKALSRMAAPRGLAVGHPWLFSEGVVPGPSDVAWGCEPHALVFINTGLCCFVLLLVVSVWSANGGKITFDCRVCFVMASGMCRGAERLHRVKSRKMLLIFSPL